MGSFDQNSSYIPPFFVVFAQTLGQFPQNVGICPDFLYIAHLGIPEIWAIARKDEFAQKSIFRCSKTIVQLPSCSLKVTFCLGKVTFKDNSQERFLIATGRNVKGSLVICIKAVL
jgi:hypothetical protein